VLRRVCVRVWSGSVMFGGFRFLTFVCACVQRARARICISAEGIGVEETTSSAVAPICSSAVDLEGIRSGSFSVFSSASF
jgi:hypothetical protein